MDNFDGWAQAASGLWTPKGAPTPGDATFSRDFVNFLTRVQDELDNPINKSFGANRQKAKPMSASEYVSMWQGVRDRAAAGGLSEDTMRQMSTRCPAVGTIINTRVNRIGALCQLPESKTDTGFKVTTRDPDHKPTKEEKDECRRLEDMILDCGFVESSEIRNGTDFEQFVRAVTRDSLELDALTFEIIPGMNPVKHPVAAFSQLDAAQMRLVEQSGDNAYRARINRDMKRVYAVQMQLGQVVQEFTWDECAYGIRNPSTNEYRLGYGIPELEQVMDVVSGILFGMAYNREYFTTSSVPPGILSISGMMSEEMLDAFRRQWQAQVQGPGNYWATPVVATMDGQGAKYTPLRASNRDMEYHQYLAFLITILCSIFCIHPEEIGMQSWAPQTSTLSSPNPQSRIDASTDRGLKPLAKLIAKLVNQKVLWRMFPDKKYIFKWVNLDAVDEEREIQLATERLNAGLTLPSQEQKMMDLEEHEFSDVPVCQAHFQAWMMKNQPQQPMMPEEGDGSEDGPIPSEEEQQNSFVQPGQPVAQQQAQGQPFQRPGSPVKKSMGRTATLEVIYHE